MADEMASTVYSLDVDEADFEREVIEASRERPVVVDFWAPWCGPCRMLGPVLDKLAREGLGAWRLAKVNVDQSPGLAQRYGVRGIPAVHAFRDGAVVDAFIGAHPEPEVRSFIDSLLPAEPRAEASDQRDGDGDGKAGVAGGDVRRGGESDTGAGGRAASGPDETELVERLERAMAVLEDASADREARAAASAVLIETFAQLGNEHALTRLYRKRMANAIW